jgi:hypothetical protein
LLNPLDDQSLDPLSFLVQFRATVAGEGMASRRAGAHKVPLDGKQGRRVATATDANFLYVWNVTE